MAPSHRHDFSSPVAEVTQHPSNPTLWGLKNLGNDAWVATLPDGTTREIEPGRSATLSVGVKLDFGQAQGEIRT